MISSMRHSLRPLSLAVAATLLLGACASRPAAIPEPLRAPLPAPDEATPGVEDDSAAPTRERITEGPRAEAAPTRVIDARRTPVRPGGKPIALALDGVNLTAFIDEVFGNQLGLSLEIEQAVRDKADLVSLRLVEPEPPHRLYEIAVEVLKRYGVGVVQEQGRVRFTASAEALAEPPQLVTGRALPDVPEGQRPIFVVMPLDAGVAGEVSAQVRNLYGAATVTIVEIPQQNALLISGAPALVEAAMETVQLFDRPAFREKRALRITPLYLSADVLAKELRDVLAGQGYSVRSGPGSPGVINLVPVPSANALIAFSESRPALDAVAQWAESLDQPAPDGGPQAGAYIYQARNTTAESLRATAEALIGGSSGAPGAAASPRTADVGVEGAARPVASASGAAQSTVTTGEDGSRLVVDPQRNAIIFQGDVSRWRTLQSVLARLDQPARQVLIEVTLAEVTLEDDFEHGIDWALRSVGVNETPSAGFDAGGVFWRAIWNGGKTRALINLLQTSGNSRVLSTPRLMVRSGETANIDVGDEVPTITSAATAPDLGGTTPSILQQIQYRSTGVQLEITPVVHSSQRVDLKISQSVSQALATTSSDIDSPTISNRQLQSSLSLNDGQPLVMGGLISEARESSRNDVPGLGQVPVLGRLFSNRSDGGRRTELILIVTPYIVEDPSQARAITEAVRARMPQMLSQDPPANP
jgi:general secretion pathway protein D